MVEYLVRVYLCLCLGLGLVHAGYIFMKSIMEFDGNTFVTNWPTLLKI